jgi:hypothetical protein
VISLSVAIVDGQTMEKMADANARLVQANSWPFVSTILSEDETEIAIGLKNDGVGPAKLHWVQLVYQGRAYGSMLKLMQECCGYQPGAADRRRLVDFGFSVADDTVLRSGETNLFFRMRNSPTNAIVYAPLRSRLLGISVRACYCSVFDECFIGDGKSLKTQAVEVCPEPGVRYLPKG